MVKHTHSKKDSSSRAEYQFQAFIEPTFFLPRQIVTNISESDREPKYVISGTVNEDPDVRGWQEPPHVALANLKTEDPKSAEAFTRRYGPLHESDEFPEFSIDSSVLETERNELQAAWEGDSQFVALMEGRVEEDIAVDVHVDKSGGVLLKPADLLTFVSFLFLRDHYADKLGICGNTDCPARYFRKKRRTQKFCEAGPCVAYAQRQYSLQWWNREGKKRREKAKQQQGRSKQ